jgi:uncharacterized membrane protein YbhN (UPF0104 family)
MPLVVRQKRHLLTAAIGLATIAGFAVMVRQTGATAVHAAASPNWTYLLGAFAIAAGVQPLRALAWSITLREPVGFRAIYAASSVGSFLDTVLPGRLGEASKVAVLKTAAGSRCPGTARTGAALLSSLLLEAIAFAAVGAVAAFFLPISSAMRISLVVSAGAAAAGLAAMTLLHRRISHRLPRFLRSFLEGAAAPWPVLARAGAIMLATWLVRCVSILLVLHAFGVHVGVGGALLYMIVTGLANTAPLLPGNAGVYQGAALGALAMIGHAGAPAVAVSLLTPVVGMVATGAAAALGLALYGRRFGELRRAAFARA